MRGWTVRLGGSLLLIGATAAWAHAQAVQLPTCQFFSVQTSVLGPDRGAAFMGGITRSRYGSTSRGVPGLSGLPGAGRLFRNRGIASGQSTAGVSVSATIIDHAELDRAVLAEAARRGGNSLVDPTLTRRASFLAQNVATYDTPRQLTTRQPDPNSLSLEAIRRQNELAERQRQADARRFWERGRQAEHAGKLGAARIYYKMAARHAASPARERILAYLKYDFDISGTARRGETAPARRGSPDTARRGSPDPDAGG